MRIYNHTVYHPYKSNLIALSEDLEYILPNGDMYKVKKGFETDGASVPWWLRWFIDPKGWILASSIIHDDFYGSYAERRTRSIELTGLLRHMKLKSFFVLLKMFRYQREYADILFRYFMRQELVGTKYKWWTPVAKGLRNLKIYSSYWYVRVFGWISYYGIIKDV